MGCSSFGTQVVVGAGANVCDGKGRQLPVSAVYVQSGTEHSMNTMTTKATVSWRELFDCLCFNYKDETVLLEKYSIGTRTKELNITENNRLTPLSIILQYIPSMQDEFEWQNNMADPNPSDPSHRYMASGCPFTVYFVSVIEEGSRTVSFTLRKIHFHVLFMAILSPNV